MYRPAVYAVPVRLLAVADDDAAPAGPEVSVVVVRSAAVAASPR
jgi:hypothetical protein